MNAFTVRRRAAAFLDARCRELSLGLLLALLAGGPLSARAQVQRNWVAFYHNSATMTNRPVAMRMDKRRNVFVAGFSQGTSGAGAVYTVLKYDANGQELWVARHLEAGDSDDRPVGLAADAQGNLFLTGVSSNALSGADFLTVKFDNAGQELWAARFNGAANGNDQAKALAVDGQGNVYVTGRGYLGASNWPSGLVVDYAYTTVKYDAAGHQLWVSRYANGHTEANPAGSSNQDAQAVAVDAAGNVYVAGISVFYPDPRSPGAGFALVKYAPDGTQLGVWRYDFPTTTDGSSGRVCLGLGPAGEVYVGGTMLPALSPPPAFTLLKAAANGTWDWVRSYYGPNPYGPGGNCFQSLAVDAAGSVLMVGTSPNASNQLDCTTVKFDTLGNQLWEDRYNPFAPGASFPSDLKLDAAGNAVVAGSGQCPDGGWLYQVVKYAPTGQRLWGALYGTGVAGESAARAVAMDEAGYCAVTGYVPAPPAVGAGQIFVTVAYSAPPGAIVLAGDGNAQVFFPGMPGSLGRLQGSTNLVDWQPLASVVVDTNGACAWEDPACRQFSARFYRCLWP